MKTRINAPVGANTVNNIVAGLGSIKDNTRV
jgi:hypothetical protein